MIGDGGGGVVSAAVVLMETAVQQRMISRSSKKTRFRTGDTCGAKGFVAGGQGHNDVYSLKFTKKKQRNHQYIYEYVS